MKIDKDTVVTIHYKVSNTQGVVLEAPKEPTSYLHGGHGNTLVKIEEALQGQEKGFATTLDLRAADAFGERDEALCRTIPKGEFPPGVKVGGYLQGRDDAGNEQHYRVLKIKGPVVLLDANHPFAGLDLKFWIQVTDVRAASAEEVAHGHAHGAHGHHHH
jgi:FKBP-type peptidyl-prolyl cis-trans isomerase SlyD